jgi:D-glycerate 3-kinase
LLTASRDVIEAAILGWLGESARRPLVLGLCGPQGSGKSTLSLALCERLRAKGLASVSLSLDDLYLAPEGRANLARTIHPLLAIRGVPGTHDVALGEQVLDDLIGGRPTLLPRFDKADDRPRGREHWEPVPAPVDVVIFEGWCVGARAQAASDLIAPINDLERERDTAGVWREHVNRTLAGPYARLFAKIHRLVLLAAPGFEVVCRWRTEQEHALARDLNAAGRTEAHCLSDEQVAAFIQHFERLTRHTLLEMPARADLTLFIDEQRGLIRAAERSCDARIPPRSAG